METVSDKKPKRKFSKTTLVVLIIIGIAVFNELFVHLIPLKGATGEDFGDYSKYPVMEVVLPMENLNPEDPNAKSVYCVEWDEGSILQNVIVKITFDRSGKLTSSDQIEVEGEDEDYRYEMISGYANVIDGVAYVDVSINRKTWIWPRPFEHYGFAVRLAD